MNQEQWQKVNELFHAAIERETEELNSFLKKACAGDEILQKEVERLLAAHQRAGEFIQKPAFPDAFQILANEQEEQAFVGHQFGAYKIIKEIGRGGMGAVFLAERADAEYKKQVAIKLIKRGMDTDSVLKRFRHERQILASLEHPNIARLLDGGTTAEGLPYFVMEYIEGLPITEYADQQKLSVTERLELFRQVCAAVSYAHQRLVIHRDIKPSNILVTKEGVPKLLDFGIAKIMHAGGGEETLATGTGMRLMTPEYASPEQVNGLPVTTLSDVYSLGVVLYELLSGRQPHRFKDRSPLVIAEAINTDELEKPSTAIARVETTAESERETLTPERIGATREGTLEKLRRRLRGDLDNIVLMALRKEPQRRYASVGQFSEDIRRHLARLPVIARPDTFSYRAAKFIQRHKVTVAAALIIFLTLLAGIVATTWQANRARMQEAFAKAEKERAERRFNDVRKLARSVLFDYHDAIKDLPGSTPIRARLVKDALEYLNSLAIEVNDDASLQLELATAYERIGDVQGGTMKANLGDTAGSIESYRKALAILQSLAASDSQNTEIRYKIAVCSRKLGTLLWETGDTKGSLEENRKALALFQELAAGNAGDFNLRFELGTTFNRVGLILLEQGDFSGALESYQKELEIYESFSATERESEKMRRAFSVTYEHLATALLSTGDFEKALENNRRGLEIRQALTNDFPLNADYRRALSVSFYWEGEILSKMGRTREALESYQKDLDIVEKLLSADPTNEVYRGDLAYVLNRVGDMQFELGNAAQAITNYRRAQSIRVEDVKADPTNIWKRSSLIGTQAKICKALAETWQVESAKTECAITLSLMEETSLEPTNAQDRSLFADTYSDIGDVYSTIARRRKVNPDERRKNCKTAREMYERSLQIWQDMQNRGIISNVNAGKPESIIRKIAECDTALNN